MIRTTLSACLLAGVLSGSAWGQTLPTPPAPAPPAASIAIVGATKVPTNGMAQLSVSGTYKSVAWLIFPDRSTGARVVSTYLVNLPNAGSAFLFTGQPGDYAIGALAVVSQDTAVGLQTVVTIQPGSPGPAPVPPPVPPTPPGPDPPPTPPPPPPPNPPVPPPLPPPPLVPVVTGKAWAVAIFDVRSPGYIAPGSLQPPLRTSNTIKDVLAAAPLSLIWRTYDVSSDEVQRSKWGKAAINMGTPSLAIFDQSGGPPLIMPLPADEAGIVAAARKARGIP